MKSITAIAATAIAVLICPIALAETVVFDGTGDWPTGGDVEIPANTPITVADTNVSAVAGWDTLKINAGATLTFANGSVAATFKASCTGSGVLYARDCAGLTISGDNRNLSGHWEFVNAAVLVAGEYGLGGPNTGAAIAEFKQVASGTPAYGTLDFRWAGQKAFTNHCALTFKADSSYTATGTAMYVGSLAADEYFVQDASFTMYNPGGSTRALKFRNNIEFMSGRFQARYTGNPFWTSADANSVVRFTGSTKICIGFDTTSDKRVAAWYALGAQTAKYYFGHTGGTRMEAFYPNTGFFYLAADGLFEDYVSTGEPWGVKNWIPYIVDQSVYKSCYDLQGHDVVFGLTSTANSEVTEKSTGYCYVTSSVPATVSLKGDFGGINVSSVSALELRGKASLTIDNNATNRFATRVSSPDGTLRVKSGALVYQWKGGWDGTAVNIEGGMLVADSARAFSGGNSALTMTGGKLKLFEAYPVAFVSATIGETELSPGTYTLARLRDEFGLGAYFEGDDAAVLNVDGPKGTWTGWPTETGAAAIVPQNAKASIHNADVASVSRLGKIVLSKGATLEIDNDETFLELACPVSGLGTIRIVNATAGVVLSGDNSGLSSPAGFYIENSKVVVSNEFGLGSTWTAATEIKFTAATSLDFGCASGHFTNHVGIVYDRASGVTGKMVFGSQSRDEYFVQDGDFFQKTGGGYDSRVVYKNNIEFLSGEMGHGSAAWYSTAQSYTRVRVSTNCTVKYRGTGDAALWMYGPGYLEGDDRLVEWHLSPKSIEGYKTLCTEIARIFCEADGVFPTGFAVQLNRSAWVQNGRSSLNLNGHDQVVNLRASADVTAEERDTARSKNHPCVSYALVTSEAPAVITSARGGNHREALRFEGAAGYCYNGAGTNKISKIVSTSTGSFEVRSGLAGFDWDSTWAGTNVVVSGTGVLFVGADSANAGVFGTRAGAKQSAAVLTVSDQGRLELEGGETVVFNAFQAGGQLRRGAYCATDNAAAKASGAVGVAWIVGDGTLRVLKGPKLGLCVIVR